VKLPAYLSVVVLALGCVVCGWFAWSEYNELVQLRAATLTGDTQASLRKDIWKADKEIADLKKRLAALSGGPGLASNAGSGIDHRDQGKPPSQEDMRKRYMELMKDPEFVRLQGIVSAGYLDQMFAGLYKKLNLTPDQVAQFRALAQERVTTMQDTYASAMEQGIDPKTDPKGFAQLMKATTDAIDTKIKDVIGEDGFKQTASYYRSGQQRAVASELQDSLSYTSSPLTDAQASQVADIVSKNAVKADPTSEVTVVNAMGFPMTMKGVGAEAPGGPDGGMQPATAVSDAAVNQAAGVLNEQQLAALKQIQVFQQSQRDLSAMSAQAKAKTGGN
jgi:hypothetical protein